jgi:hypothetical protein
MTFACTRRHRAALCLCAALVLAPGIARAQTEIVGTTTCSAGAGRRRRRRTTSTRTARRCRGTRRAAGGSWGSASTRRGATPPSPSPASGRTRAGSTARGSGRARRRGCSSRLRMEAGVTGPPSLAEPVQNGLHRLAGYRPQLGWRHQLGFEPGAVVSCGREHRLLSTGRADATRLEVLPSWTVRAGNVRTGADAGLRARLGFRAGDAWTADGAAGGVSGWMEAGGRGEAVLRDLFLDGSTFGGRESGVGGAGGGGVRHPLPTDGAGVPLRPPRPRVRDAGEAAPVRLHPRAHPCAGRPGASLIRHLEKRRPHAEARRCGEFLSVFSAPPREIIPSADSAERTCPAATGFRDGSGSRAQAEQIPRSAPWILHEESAGGASLGMTVSGAGESSTSLRVWDGRDSALSSGSGLRR